MINKFFPRRCSSLWCGEAKKQWKTLSREWIIDSLDQKPLQWLSSGLLCSLYPSADNREREEKKTSTAPLCWFPSDPLIDSAERIYFPCLLPVLRNKTVRLPPLESGFFASLRSLFQHHFVSICIIKVEENFFISLISGKRRIWIVNFAPLNLYSRSSGVLRANCKELSLPSSV